MQRLNQCPQFVWWMLAETPKGARVLDVGCGNKWYWTQLQANDIQLKGVDVFAPFEPDYCIDLTVENLPTDLNPDIIYMFDVIEHMEKARGFEILEQAKEIAPIVMLLTPTIWGKNDLLHTDPESDYFENIHDEHQSLWAPADFADFKAVKGVFGSNYFHGVWSR